MKLFYSCFLLLLITISCDQGTDQNDSKTKKYKSPTKVDNTKKDKATNTKKEASYSETADWIVSKMNRQASRFEGVFYQTSEFEETYSNFTLTYDDIRIEYGMIKILERYKYHGGSPGKENNYDGFTYRNNLVEIPINDITYVDFKLDNSPYCNMIFKTNKESVKVTRNMPTSVQYNDLEFPNPIKGFMSQGSIFIRCELEKDLKKRMDEALKHLKKLNIKRYPERKEAF